MNTQSAIRAVEASVNDELKRLAPLANTKLDNAACVNARKRRKQLVEAWSLLKQELKGKVK